MTEDQQPNRFVVNLSTDNAAFEDDSELPRILRKIAADIEADPTRAWYFQTIFDVNGNDVGRYALKPSSYFD